MALRKGTDATLASLPPISSPTGAHRRKILGMEHERKHKIARTLVVEYSHTRAMRPFMLPRHQGVGRDDRGETNTLRRRNRQDQDE